MKRGLAIRKKRLPLVAAHAAVSYVSQMGFSASEHIDCSRDLVWAVMTDWSKSAYWLGIEKLRLADPKQPERAGSQLLYNARGSQTSTITRWEPEKALTLESTQAGVTAVYEYTLTEQEGRTRVELNANCSAQGTIWKFLLPLIRFLMERTDRRQVAALKRLTETVVAAAERKADKLQAKA